MKNQSSEKDELLDSIFEKGKSEKMAKENKTEEFDVSGWVKEQIGFPPYWRPEIGVSDDDSEEFKPNSFIATVIAKDDKGEFDRWILKALTTITCQEGEASDAKEVVVKRGDMFTCSVYTGLPLETYIGEQVFVKTIKKRMGVGQGKFVWNFDLLVSPETSKRLENKRVEQAKQLAESNPL